jgi:hypothetical protein
MFGKAELEQLRVQKQLLVLQSDVNRLLLTREWQRLRSPETWMDEAGSLIHRHPIWIATLAAAVGRRAARFLHLPGEATSGIRRLGKLALSAVVIWKLIRRQKPGAGFF